MPLTAYLKAGDLKGAAPNGQVPLIACTHEISTKVDPTTGRSPEGKTEREHKPFFVRKHIDLSTPIFHKAQTLNTPFPTVEIRFVHNPPSGPAANYVTVVLKDARVVSIESVMPNLAFASNTLVHEYEEIGFAYASIEWKEQAIQGHQTGAASGSDDKDAGLLFAPDWIEEQARAAGFKMLAELEKKGIKYGKGLYQKMVDAFKAELQPPADPKK